MSEEKLKKIGHTIGYFCGIVILCCGTILNVALTAGAVKHLLFQERKCMYESDDKMVSHPGHYKSKNGMEVIDVIDAFTADLSGIEATDTGNIIKYACRWYAKNGIQDLKKIMWYTQHLIDHLEAKQNSNKEENK